MRQFWRNLFRDSAGPESLIPVINGLRADLHALSDAELKAIDWRASGLAEVIALTAVVAERVLGLKMFDVQLQGALALTAGKIAEMQTGEGKTLAAVPAVVWFAREGAGVHVMTVNDYLARRDAQWMGGIYEFLGLSVGYFQQGMEIEERRRAYACDITYATANEIGFDLLRDGLALYPQRAGAAPVWNRGDRRSRFHPDRRSAHSAGDRGRSKRASSRWLTKWIASRAFFHRWPAFHAG